MEELEAINMLLRAVGVSPVNSVDTPYPNVANARATLTRTRRKVQGQGWWFNIDYGVTFVRDDNGIIRIPTTIRAVVMQDTRYIQRGNRMYDRVAQTYTFTCDLTAIRVVRVLEWGDMPPSVQELCAYTAAAEFVRDELEDPQKSSEFAQLAGTAGIAAKKQELEEGRYNMYQQPQAQRMRLGVQPYNRNNQRFHGDPDV
jgi:hypothetical protein